MKRITASFWFLFALSLNCLYASGPQWECKVSNTAQGQITQMVSTNQPVVVILVDFPDGRLPDGSLPTQDSDTTLVANLDAVGSLGYTDPRGTSRIKIRKYAYEDYWDMVFSTNTWVGTRHPDYYDLLGFDPDGANNNAEKPFDLTVYGSVSDYWAEVSYGNLMLQAYQTHNGSVDKYHTGIVNNIISSGGKNYVRWIKLDYNKSVYLGGRDPIADVIAKVRSLHQLPTSDPEYLAFDINNYPSTGKIAIITAGGRLGGWAYLGGQYAIVTEKMQYLTNNDRYSFFAGIGELSHEFGHTIGLPHYIAGPYDLMFWGGFSERKEYFSPPHINPRDKIAFGWIPSSNIHRIRSNQSLQLPPINTTPEVAVVTLYGDAGRNNDYTHSEYLLIEYRKREGFNRYTGGVGTTGFTGGGLIWHYSAYDAFPIVGDDVDTHLGLKVANYGTSFMANPGDPSQLFYPGHSTLSSSTTPNSNSVTNLVTGVNINNFSYSGNNLSFTVNYDLGTPPQYDYFLDNNYNYNNNSLSGKIFVGITNPYFSSLTLAGGSQVDIASNVLLSTTDFIANGTEGNPVVLAGVGYGTNKCRWNSIKLDHPSSASQINYCTIKNSLQGIYVYAPNDQIAISNSSFSDNSSWDIKLFKELSNPRYLPIIDENTTFTKLIMGNDNWLTTSFQVLNIPSNSTFQMAGGTEIKFDEGSSVACYGQLLAQGTATRKVKFTSLSGNTPASWDGITFSGAAASSSSMSYCTVENAYAVQCYDGANVSINNSTISNNTYGILCYGSNPVISNNTISNSVYRGIQNTMNANPRIEGNTISNNVVTTNSYGVYCYGGNGYINSNKITGFEIGVYPRAGSSLGAWSGLDYNQTPAQNNVITGNTYGVDTYDQGHAFLGYIDNYGVIHGGNNYIGGNTGYDLVANNYTWLYASGNWFGTDQVPTFAQGSSVYAFRYDMPLTSDPWGGIYQKVAAPQQESAAISKSVASNTSDALSYQAGSNAQKTEDKLYRDAVQEHMTKSYGSARDKYKQLLSSSKYGKSALVLLSHLLTETNEETALSCLNDIKANRQKYSLSEENLPLATNLLAKLEGYKGNYDKALTLYDEVIRKYPNTTDERNARIQEIYYVITGKKDRAVAKQLLNDLLAIYKSGDDIDMIVNLFDHAKYSLPTLSKSFSNQQQVEMKKEEVPTEFSISQNYPNPFNPSTTISFAIPQASMVSIKVFDLLGREVTTLVNEYKTEGRHSVTFNASQLSSGIYLYRIQAGAFISTKKMQMLK